MVQTVYERCRSVDLDYVTNLPQFCRAAANDAANDVWFGLTTHFGGHFGPHLGPILLHFIVDRTFRTEEEEVLRIFESESINRLN